MIRRANSNEVEQIMAIWLKGNMDAHPFISPAYWQVHYEAVAEAIAKLCSFVYVEEGFYRIRRRLYPRLIYRRQGER